MRDGYSGPCLNVFCILNFMVAEENNVISGIDNFVWNKDIVPVEEKL